jgi:hypothetical protein
MHILELPLSVRMFVNDQQTVLFSGGSQEPHGHASVMWALLSGIG